MLVLSRTVDGRIRVTVPGELLTSGQPLNIDVCLCYLRGERAGIGFDADRRISIDRMEVLEAIHRENNPSRGPLP